MPIFPALAKLDAEHLLNLFSQSPIYDNEDEFLYYSEIAWYVFQKMQESGIEQIVNTSLQTENEARLRSVIFLMGCSSYKEKYEDILGKYLTNNHPLIVAEAIGSLGHLEASKHFDAILHLHNSSSPFIRGRVLAYVRRLRYPQAKELLLLALDDKHYAVREWALDELDELGDTSIIQNVVPLLDDDEASVRQAAQTTLQSLQDLLNYSE
jgi:HEAT repeat protein